MLDFILIGISILVAVGGWVLARNWYREPSEIPKTLSEKYAGLYRLVLNKYWVDEFYDRFVVRVSQVWGRVLWLFDQKAVDGMVRGVAGMIQGAAFVSNWIEKYIIYSFLNLVAYFNQLSASFLRLLQTGMVHHYAALIVLGLFILVNVFLLFTLKIMASS